jgi:hypothetical protein
MPPQQQLQWKGPPVPRAKPVPPEKWEEHKEELCGLYQKMALDDLMAMMKVRHGFAPSYVPLSYPQLSFTFHFRCVM